MPARLLVHCLFNRYELCTLAPQIGDYAVVEAGQRVTCDDAIGEDLPFALRRRAA